MPDPFSVSKGELNPHWNTLGAGLAALLDSKASRISLRLSRVGEAEIASIVGEAVRRAGRLRGDPMPVAPLRSLRGTWEAWVGYREVWNSLPGTEKFVFASSDITLFFTIAGTEDFQQILRAEWMGLTDNAGDWTFTPGNAAHPHWQIDITETLKSDTDLQTARELLRDSAPREFGAVPSAPFADPPWYRIGHMHFASAMRPWTDGEIAHCPSNLGAVRKWVIATIALLRTELVRL